MSRDMTRPTRSSSFSMQDCDNCSRKHAFLLPFCMHAHESERLRGQQMIASSVREVHGRARQQRDSRVQEGFEGLCSHIQNKVSEFAMHITFLSESVSS